MIEVNGLSKSYGTHRAVNDVSFNISKGEVVGFLGPNGAGKSTIMNILTGYISLSEGEVKIDGFDILHVSGLGNNIAEGPQQLHLIGHTPEISVMSLAFGNGIDHAVQSAGTDDVAKQGSTLFVETALIEVDGIHAFEQFFLSDIFRFPFVPLVHIALVPDAHGESEVIHGKQIFVQFKPVFHFSSCGLKDLQCPVPSCFVAF